MATETAEAPSHANGRGAPQAEGAPSPVAESSTGAATVDDLIASNSAVYTSPAGLRYARGTQHGHHLRHVMAHAAYEPDRPGQHGVFDSDSVTEVVALVDEAYTRALSGRATRKRTEGDRTIYTVDMGRRIGFVGGQSGRRRGHPAAERVRLVLVGKKLITAYPVGP